uniref:Exonuclease 3'-5' domain-containing protein 2 n=1 Tax=Leptobrachium leishanense TaxID=445787 RepID=A0A8C5WI61_9ANUR
MPRHPGLTLGVASLVGTTVGCLILWKLIRRRRLSAAAVQKIISTNEHPCCDSKDEQDTGSSEEYTPVSAVEDILEADIKLVSDADEWEKIWLHLEKELSYYKVLGIDCEWVSIDGKKNPVSLLQLASYSGFCVLVRLPQFIKCGTTIPKSFLSLLADRNILKVGVGCCEDSRKLFGDYGFSVQGLLDIRHIALRQRKEVFQNTLSLKSLSETILSFPLDKSFQLRCSNWDAEEFSDDQVLYAARDAQVSVAIFLHLLGFFSQEAPCSWECLLTKCEGLVDVPFKTKSLNVSNCNINSMSRTKSRKSEEKLGMISQGKNRKPLGVGYSARKAPLYDNCFLYAPDGQPLCTCDRKKAQWYLSKGIGDLVSTEPFIVKLRFEPSGRPESNVDYYLTVKENLCVVCGNRESYIRKNIVPHEYRRHFPAQMKDHNSHDVLLLCTSCHAISNLNDTSLKQQLAEDCNAPTGCEEGLRLLEDPVRRQVRSAARALLNSSKLPDQRTEELLKQVKNFYGVQQITNEHLKEAASLETSDSAKSVFPKPVLRTLRLARFAGYVKRSTGFTMSPSCPTGLKWCRPSPKMELNL